jgi:glycosyltransferase involved in cell wall biosynthesis
VRNVVDSDLFAPRRDSEAGGRPVFVHVSGLTAGKNVSGILEAMRSVRDRQPQIELEIIGDGPHRQGLEELARELDLLDRGVSFAGHLAAAEVAAAMAGARALILFSDYENSPCVLAEAAAAAVPVIATRTGGIPEVVNRDTGILIEPGDRDGLVEAILAIADNRRRFDRGLIRRHGVETFSKRVIGGLFVDLYRRVLDHRLDIQPANTS